VSWEQHTIASEALRDNPLGDPFERPLWIWSPPGVSRSYPTVYVLHAHMRSGPSWFNVDPFERSYPAEIEDLAPEAIVVLVDAWTAVGGSQWIDSDGVGLYGTYLRDEVVPFVDAHYPTNGVRGLQGKSSGGYGAIVNALERPDLFHAVAAHAPVALFDVAVAHDFPAAARALRERGGTLEDALRAIDGLGSHADVILVEVGSLAYAFSGGELPFEVDTGRLVPDVWKRWLEHDPVRLAATHADAARGLQGVWLDAGRSDEYFLDLGAVALRDALLEAGLREERLRFELFDGGHRGVSGRYPASLAYLVGGLSISF
jgi:enterochelin esterase-like enzyme